MLEEHPARQARVLQQQVPDDVRLSRVLHAVQGDPEVVLGLPLAVP